MLSVVWIAYAVPALLVKIPFFQRQIAQTTTAVLSDKLGVPVKIGQVDIEWLNRLVVEELYLEDQEGRVMFKANHVAASFDILPLFNGRLAFNTVRLFGPDVHLGRKSMADPLNLQFVIDAFAPKDTTPKNPNIDLRFNTVLIRQGRFRYDVEDAPLTPGKFNAKHVDVHDLSAKISLKALRRDSIHAQIKKFTLKESSGFSLEKLALSVIGNPDSLFLQKFEVKLPHSNLRIADARIDLTQVDSLNASVVDSALLRLKITPSHICLKDISAFVPAFQNFNDSVELSAKAKGTINHIDLENLTLKYSNKMLLVGQMELRGVTRPQEAFLLGRVSKMYITSNGLEKLVNNFRKEPANLPLPLQKLGTINFTGEISGLFNHLVAYGKLSTAIGSLQMDVLIGNDKEKEIAAFLKGHVQTGEIDVAQLFGNDTPLGIAQCGLDIDANRPVGGHFAGHINMNVNRFDYKGYSYENMLLSGNFRRNAFDGTVQIKDPNGSLFANGIFEHRGENSVFNFTADLKHFRPDRLNLSDKYEDPDISLSLNADFVGNNIDNIEGEISLDSIDFRTKPDSFFIKQFVVAASGLSSNRDLKITSDILNGEIKGAYSFATIVPNFLNTVKEYIPALVKTGERKKEVEENNFTMLLTLNNTEEVSRTLKLPFAMRKPGRILGSYNNIYNKFRFEAYLPQFSIGKSQFESGFMHCSNSNNQFDFSFKATQYNAKGLRNYMDVSFDAKDNKVNTHVQWANNKSRTFKADLMATTRFIEQMDENGKSDLSTEIKINPTALVINDTIWNINPSKITIEKGKVAVDHFSISRNKEFLAIDGVISNEVSDTLNLELNNIELSYIFDILNIPVLQFAGKATGKFNVCDLMGSRMINTDLEIQNFSFNQVGLGKLNLFSEWDDAQKGILMLGTIYTSDAAWTDVSGYIYPVRSPLREAGLSLFFDATDINVAFLHPFMEKVAKDIKGRGYGNVHLYGPFHELAVEGDAYVKDGGLGIDFLDTYYTFSDSIHMDSTSIKLKDLTVYDKYNNSGKVDLTVNHTHFRNIDFHVNVQANNILAYDVAQKHNPLIYGTVFASGSVGINGNEQLINFDINMQSQPKTHIFLNFMGNSTAADYDFITFVDKGQLKNRSLTETMQQDSLPKPLQSVDEGAEMRMNFLLDITPDAEIELIMDPHAGDKIKGSGSGSMQIQYGTKSDLRMYGNYAIQDGIYNFSLQQLIHKDFKIREGSLISFNGDPFNANMDINAIYNLTANLSDLDQSLALESPRTNVPVNCVLLLDGMLRQPNISFDLELPGSNEELERQMKSLIDTDDMMTRQIIYLLVLNKFYTPEYTGQNSNDFTAVASSALSSQISSLLSTITDKVQIGTNIRAGEDWGMKDTEVEMLLSSQLLNNRLLFNGNFGYKNNPTQKNAFIGEFDLEYKLNRSGEIRLKAYNHMNDLYQYLKQALTTQGVGILFKKDFTRINELFHRNYRVLQPSSRNSLQPKEAIIRKDSTETVPSESK